MFLVSFCQETVNAWKLAGILVLIVRVMVPIVIIITCLVPFLDALIKGDSKTLFDSGKTMFKKIFAGLIVFFIPTIISTTVNILVNSDYVNEEVKVCSVCLDKPNGDECNSAVEDQKRLLEEETEEFKEEEINGSVDTSELKDNEIDSNQESNSNRVKGTINIIIGDSRTVGMCASFTGDWTGCNTGDPFINGNNIYISKGSTGYSWFDSSAVPSVNTILNAGAGTTYNIISLMGVNYLLSDIDKYIVKYNELALGSWAKHNIIIVSVNPVDESVESQNGYSTKNSDIESFNEKLKNGILCKSNMTYCDVYNQIKDNFGTEDGLHYNDTTYQTIYNKIMQCV